MRIAIVPLLLAALCAYSLECAAEEEEDSVGFGEKGRPRVELCNCLPSTSLKSAMRESTMVFVGKVVSKLKYSVPQISPDYQEYKIKLRVERYWKGNVPRIVEVRTPVKFEHCAQEFEMGRDFLVWAAGKPFPIVTACTRTNGTWKQADDDLALLTGGERPPLP